MGYQVLARKWRPQSFEDVVGQETVTRTLQNAIKSDRLAHAFLFSGVRGVGKTTTARILAKALNCQEGPTAKPCSQCASCQEITNSNSVDVLEIDAASNTGVDNIRELRESVIYGTARDQFKIFIIDEVHMLSNAAFNALLKTLEEPPPHVKFILATTELQKIPVTITSRCQQFDFKPISFSLILERLKSISRQEEIEISDYALRAVVSCAQGSMRDAQSALDQVIAFSGEEVSDEDVQALLGVVDDEVVIGVMDSILQCRRKDLLDIAQKLADSGVNAQVFCRKLIQHVRNLMVCRIVGWEEKLLNLVDARREAFEQQAQEFSDLDLIRCYDVLNRTENELRWHSNPHVHLEMMLMKLIELSRLPSVEEVISDLKSGGQIVSLPEEAKKRQVKETSLLKMESSEKQSKKSDSAPVEKKKNPIIAQLLSEIQSESIRLYSSLQHATLMKFEDGMLSVIFPSRESFHHGVVLEVENQDRLSKICEKIVGDLPAIEVQLEGTDERVEDPAEDPKVKAFIEVFPGKIIVEKEVKE